VPSPGAVELRPRAHEGGTDTARGPRTVSIEVGSKSARESEQRPNAPSISFKIPSIHLRT